MAKEDKRAKILSLLITNGYVSGEFLAKKLGISRVAVWKHMQGLRGQGYGIESSPKLGYRLISRPDKLLPMEITAGLQTEFIGRQVYHREQVPSTMELAGEFAKKGAPEGTLVIAEEQSSGRGRLGRNWLSPYGQGIWQTVILRPNCPPQHMGIITMLGALSAAKAIQRVTGLPAMVKWPNDIIVAGKKIGGILTELTAEADVVHFVNLGIGLNVNLDEADFAIDLPDKATSIKMELGRQVSRLELELTFLAELERLYLQFKAGDYSNILAQWRQYDITLGSQVKVTQRTQEIEGKALDVDETGYLVLQLPDGSLRKIFAGDVVIKGL